MIRKAVPGIMLTLLFIGMLTLACNIRPVKSEPTTWTVDDDGPADFHTIQEAINAAISGDTLLVYNGTYNENPIVNKTLLLIGESRSNAIIIGNVLVEASHVQFKGFSVEGDMPGSGITLSYSDDSVMGDNKVTSKRWAGIILREYSNNNIISNNIVVDNEYGINIGYFGGPVGCNNNVIVNNIVSNNTIGIEICTASTGNKIFGNIVENNSDGGILLLDAGTSDNKIYHNNMLYNGEAWHRNAEDLSSNIWDDGLPSGGNFWSDYTGLDADGDGVGDTPYIIDADNQDRYPLMYPWSSLPVHNMNTGLGYETIQEAINANETLDRHMIFVEEGTYYEHLVVNKGISLVGVNRSTTIIDGSESGSVVTVSADVVLIQGFTVQKSGTGLGLPSGIDLSTGRSNCTIVDNIVANNKGAISLGFGGNHTITNNTIMSNYIGITVIYSLNVRVFHNWFQNNTIQVSTTGASIEWDNGYPSGGNYWSDYRERYPNATEIDASGIWNTPYQIDVINKDYYPIIPEFQLFPMLLSLVITSLLAITGNRRSHNNPRVPIIPHSTTVHDSNNASSHSLQKETCKDFRESLEVFHRRSNALCVERRKFSCKPRSWIWTLPKLLILLRMKR